MIKNQLYKFDEKPIELADLSVVEGAGDPELFTGEVLPEEYEDIKKLGEAMIKFCVENGGAGLAAPQVGVFKKMFIWNNAQNQFQIVVNPIFFPDNVNKTTGVVEGCLTYPDQHFYLRRFKSGNARYDILDPKDNTKFKKVFRKLTGERAIIWQHELDHLSGKTINTIGTLFEVKGKEKE